MDVDGNLELRNPWWSSGTVEAGKPRDRATALERAIRSKDPAVTAVIGMRRCGKSTLLKQGVHALLNHGVEPSRIWWVDFEDVIFDELGRDVQALDTCLRAFIERHGAFDGADRPHLFLDEIQRVDGWHRWVRTIHETKQATVTVTGSSSKLLASDLARSTLTGRTFAIELWPLSFREYLRFLEYEPDDPTLRQRLPELLRRYFNDGGMPGLVSTLIDAREEEDLRERQRQLLDSILLNDVVERHGVRDVEDLRALVRAYFADTAKTFTFRSLRDRFDLSNDQVRSYTGYIEEAFLIRVVEKYDHKQHVRLREPRKVHAVDTGICNVAVVTGRRDFGALAETAAYMELVRRGHGDRLYWWGDGGSECDTVIKTEGGGTAIQVWMGDEQAPPERERRGIEQAREALRLSNGLILTNGQTPSRSVGGVREVPIWDWLLEADDEQG